MEILLEIIAYGLLCGFLGYITGKLRSDYLEKEDRKNLEY